MKKKLIKLIALFSLYKTNWKAYKEYYFSKKKILYKYLRNQGFYAIKVAQRLEWKVSYGSFYYNAKYNNQQVFVKVTSKFTQDGYFNEILCNEYIRKKSEYLYHRSPRLLKYSKFDDFYIIVFECVEIDQTFNENDFQCQTTKFIDEFSKIGMIHQDLKITNVTIHNNSMYLLDYGYSLCPASNNVRRTNCNFINYITETAKQLLPNADFYFDDAVSANLFEIDREKINFLVGKDDLYFMKTFDEIIKYQLIRLGERQIWILRKFED